MIQELLSAVVEERKLSISKGGLLSDAPSPFLPPTSVGGTSIQQHNPLSSPSSTTGSDPPQQKLKCPRCDSSNTKFCYYNNYNLTQPRHFCKTCRRYWTKGGALRNVPIGGGCRKAKPIQIAAAKPSKLSKPVAPSLEVITRAGLGLGPEHDFVPPIPSLWTPPPPHLLALLRAGGAGIGTYLADSPWRNEGHVQHYAQLPESGFGDAVGIQGMDLAAEKAVYGNGEFAASSGWSALVGGSTSMGGEFGCAWNPALSWSDMSRTN